MHRCVCLIERTIKSSDGFVRGAATRGWCAALRWSDALSRTSRPATKPARCGDRIVQLYCIVKPAGRERGATCRRAHITTAIELSRFRCAK